MEDTSESHALDVSLEARLDCEGDSTVVAFTLNPNPKRYNSSDPNKQYEQIFMLLLSKAPKIFDKFLFTPELTQQGNIHIHGYYIVKDKIKYFKWWLPKAKNIGYVKVKMGDITEEWYDYCDKDIELMSELIDDLPVPYTHYNEHDYLKRWNDRRKMQAYNRYIKRKKKPSKPKSILEYLDIDDIPSDCD